MKPLSTMAMSDGTHLDFAIERRRFLAAMAFGALAAALARPSHALLTHLCNPMA